ncbi:MAG TPA: ATP-dependent helicase [Candidatus Sulfomarinibacteraceae bacterium]|nr:ATP-dependent helicase [Candidatus Sulfomarinibacteraceae bacterium]
MQNPLPLTPAQQAVVDHDEGPALVFAVAGAGKTTAMVHRIERLVREGHFPASHILATSFGKGNEIDLKEKLQAWPRCRRVNVRTLHALGRSFIVAAQEQGYWPNLRLDNGPDGEDGQSGAAQALLSMTINEARRRSVAYEPELESIDRLDFLTYVAACKGNLRYANFDDARLPPEVHDVAGPAKAPEGNLFWYLNLYRLFEQVRLARGVITFADMLMTGWETLVRYPDVLAEVQARYRCVLVDEYQDINLAQAEILNLITAPRRNYMAIGDDDQTIYEWRGANPRFILDFERRYQAAKYVIDDNFRCPVGPVLFANRVIAHNEQRQEKALSLTRGFEGETALDVHEDAAAMARRVVRKMETLQKAGHAWREMAVLVRLNAQTPYLEQALIATEIPFRVSKPFYERWEIKTLIYYVRLAWVEQALQDDQELTARQKRWFAEAWQAVYNRPKRYLSRALHDQVRGAVLSKGLPPSQALRLIAPQAPHDGIAENVEFLSEDLAWLAKKLKSDAASTLRDLELRLDYKAYLRESSGFPQTGEGRAVGVEAFIGYARGKGSLLAFMRHIRELAQKKIGRDRDTQDDVVTLSTIHGAKGLEWPVVFVAGCNQEIMPFSGKDAQNLEEERRLFYVALTRSSRHLYLHAVQGQPLSQFLREARWRQLLPTVRYLQKTLSRDPQTWQAQEAWILARNVQEHGLSRYFRRWWDAPPDRQRAVAQTMVRFFQAVAGRDAWEPLSLRPDQARTWQSLLDGSPPADQPAEPLPGLAQLLAQKGQTANGRSDAAELETPSVLSPGLWVRCDAGWGRVERITDARGQVMGQIPREAGTGRLHLTLRPGLDGVSVEIDLEARRILFPESGRFYTCTRCNCFSSPDPVVVSSDHNDIAHDGVGASYKVQRKGYQPLNHLLVQREPPQQLLG